MSGVLSDEEFVVLYDENRSKNLDFLYDEYGRFDLDKMTDSECIPELRVKKSDLPKLREALQIPDSFTCYQKSVGDGMEGLCMLLRRFAYFCRYSNRIPRFGRPTPLLSMLTNEVLDFICNTHSDKITFSRSPSYTDPVYAKGAALNNCFGFIDGTVRPIVKSLSSPFFPPHVGVEPGRAKRRDPSFRPPGFSPYMEREERRVQGLDYQANCSARREPDSYSCSCLQRTQKISCIKVPMISTSKHS